LGPGFETTKNLLRRPHPHRGGVFLIPVQELLFSFVDLFDIVPGDFDVFDPGDFDIFPGVLNVFDPGDFDVFPGVLNVCSPGDLDVFDPGDFDVFPGVLNVFAPGDFDELARDFDVVAGLVCS
jgi:hypothetical protein